MSYFSIVSVLATVDGGRMADRSTDTEDKQCIAVDGGQQLNGF